MYMLIPILIVVAMVGSVIVLFKVLTSSESSDISSHAKQSVSFLAKSESVQKFYDKLK